MLRHDKKSLRPRHYDAVLGAKVERSMTYGQMPGNTTKGEDKDRVMHCALKLGACTLMLSDAPPRHAEIVGTNVEVSASRRSTCPRREIGTRKSSNAKQCA